MDNTTLLISVFVVLSIVFTMATVRSNRRRRRAAHLSQLGKAVPRILTPAGTDIGIVTPKRTGKPRAHLD